MTLCLPLRLPTHLSCFFLFFFFLKRFYYLARDDFKLKILLLPPRKSWVADMHQLTQHPMGLNFFT